MTRKSDRLPVRSQLGNIPARTIAEEASRRWMNAAGVSHNGAPARVSAGDQLYAPVALLWCACRWRVGYVEIYDPRPRGQELLTVARLQHAVDARVRPAVMREVAVILDAETPLPVHTFCPEHGPVEVPVLDLMRLAGRSLVAILDAPPGAKLTARRLTLKPA